ncbi:MAG: ABC transporter permease [Gammaproteobacteria bacterium]|nr:ABC transporter permease [Gammaproteobacteria bacterium]NVK88438.1 ABC transporter permease [Gammaproteobacteria bacterium]
MKSATLRIYYLEAKFEFLKAIRVPAFTLPSLIFPAMFYIFFGLMFNSGSHPQHAAYLMATYAVFGIIGPALFSFGVGVAIEKDQGWLQLKQASPMPISAYFFARAVSAALFGLVIVMLLFTLGALFGDVRFTHAEWLLSLLALILGSLPFAALGLLLGLSVKGQAAAAVVNLIYLPMAFLSGLWLPIQMLPDFFQYFAWIFPAFHLAQIVLAIQEQSLGYPIVVHLLSLVAMTLLFVALAMRAYRRA